MKKILIIVKDHYPAIIPFDLTKEEKGAQEISAIIIQKGQILPDPSYKKVLALQASAKESLGDPPIPTISYQDFLEEIFSADTAMVI